jgi:hypothetical protein
MSSFEKQKHPFLELGEKGRSITPRLKELRSSSEGEGLEEKEVNKHEVYALIGHTMEGVLREIGTLTENQETLSLYIDKLISDRGLGLTYDREGGLHLNVEEVGNDPVEVLYTLWQFRSLLGSVAEDILRGEAGNLKQNEGASLNRLHTIARSHKRDWNREHLFQEQNGFDILRRGMTTASKESWGLFLSLPIIFQKSIGREMTEDDLGKLLPQIGKLLLKMASLHLETASSVDVAVSSFMSGSHRFSKVQLTGFDYINNLAKRYVIHEGGETEEEGLHIDFNEEWLDSSYNIAKIRKVKIDAEQRHGCPVRNIHLRDQEEKLVSGIQAVAFFYTNFAKQAILPHQKLLVESFEKIQRGDYQTDLDD